MRGVGTPLCGCAPRHGGGSPTGQRATIRSDEFLAASLSFFPAPAPPLPASPAWTITFVETCRCPCRDHPPPGSLWAFAEAAPSYDTRRGIDSALLSNIVVQRLVTGATVCVRRCRHDFASTNSSRAALHHPPGGWTTSGRAIASHLYQRTGGSLHPIASDDRRTGPRACLLPLRRVVHPGPNRRRKGHPAWPGRV